MVPVESGPLTMPSVELQDADAGEHINIIKIEKTNEPLGDISYIIAVLC